MFSPKLSNAFLLSKLNDFFIELFLRYLLPREIYFLINDFKNEIEESTGD
jgi:hypothetical protein